MKTSKKIVAGLAVIVGLSALTLGNPIPATAQGTTVPPIAGQRGGERHPELRRALRTLERTETDLRRSARDFGGHREKAADLCHQAQQEIQLALQYDKN